MDDIVRQAMVKWPNVPDCFGWLALDNRGDWYMRDDRIQAQGLFPTPKGSRLLHEKLIAFIGRNYLTDDSGCWFFQNGPQRVFVELQTCPWVYRLYQPESGRLQVTTHTGVEVEVDQALTDESGRVFLQTPMGLGLVHSQDMMQAAQAIETGLWHLKEVNSLDLTTQFGFVKSPKLLREKHLAT
jgi:hypothetical protein